MQQIVFQRRKNRKFLAVCTLGGGEADGGGGGGAGGGGGGGGDRYPQQFLKAFEWWLNNFVTKLKFNAKLLQ
jgi:hypothetical protein